MDSWQPVPLEATIGFLVGENLAISGIGPDGRRTLVLVKVTPRRAGTVWVWVSDTATRTPMPRAIRSVTDETVTLRAAVLAHCDVEAFSAATVPHKVKWPSDVARTRTNLWFLLGALASLIAMIVLIVVDLPAVAMAFMVPTVMMGLMGRKQGGTSVNPPAAILSPSSSQTGFGFTSEVLPSTVLARIPPPETAAGVSPAERVGVVKARYGAKLSDIVYRIENSALFDPSVPETQRFQVALLAWDENSPDAEHLADEVERAFDEALRTAEKRGLDHLPETARDPARRAAKAATVAVSDAPPAEREAAAKRVAEILNSLALFYLPVVDPSTPSLIGRRREIEPGR